MCSHGMSGNLWRPGNDFRDISLLQLFNDVRYFKCLSELGNDFMYENCLVLSVNYYVSIHAKVSL